MTPEEAIEVIAREMIARLVDDFADSWEDYPEIGEHDWERVVDKAEQLVAVPKDLPYAEALKLLEDRAQS